MAIDKQGWSKDVAANVGAKQAKYVHAGDLSLAHAKYVSNANKTGALTSKLQKTAGIAGKGKASSVIHSKGV
ncbi:MAG: hypothetical protein Q8L37_07205 [Candidatus Gottesmanbacteria bacterium]|nr:hypothetical protein [Candidatus Gottesmanbacteria bacterium]